MRTSSRGTPPLAAAVLAGTMLVSAPGGVSASDASATAIHDLARGTTPTAALAASVAETGEPAKAPRFARLVPRRTTQVIRTVRTNRWCNRRWCTVTQLWQKDDGAGWRKLRSFRSSIGPNGFGKRREGDQRSPSGVYRITVTFSTGRRPPGDMPWKRRLPTSNVTNYAGRLYNTWIEESWRTDGDRPSMRWGLIVDYNNPRLAPGVGPKPKQGKGSGIFYHTSLTKSRRWRPTDGCTQIGRRHQMRKVLRWLDPAARPRIVQDR